MWRVIAVLGPGEDLAEADIGAVPGATVRVRCDVLAPCDLARTVVDGTVLDEELACRSVLHHSHVLCEVVVVLSRPVLVPILAIKAQPAGVWRRPTPPAMRGADVCPGACAGLVLVLYWADLEVVILSAESLVVVHAVDFSLCKENRFLPERGRPDAHAVLHSHVRLQRLKDLHVDGAVFDYGTHAALVLGVLAVE